MLRKTEDRFKDLREVVERRKAFGPAEVQKAIIKGIEIKHKLKLYLPLVSTIVQIHVRPLLFRQHYMSCPEQKKFNK